MKNLFILFLLLSNATLFAQIKIIGKVINAENTTLNLAEVILSNKDSIAIKNDYTNEKGEFLLETKSGWYKLEIRQSNKILYAKSFDIIADLDLGIITVNNVNQLESVTVVGKRKLIERKVDRLVFNIENSISANGGDALDALKITPGMKVQNDKISIIGKSTVGVMIDDKLIQLTEEDLANFLRTIPSDNIKNIEVITTPPAKYDALGNSGLINIKLKKAKANSWNAVLGSAFLQRKTYGEGSVLGNFNYNNNKLSVSSSINYRNGGRYIEQDDYANFSDGLWYTSSPFTIKHKRFNGKIGLDYKLTSKWTIGGQYILNGSNSNFTDSPYVPVFDYNTNEVLRYLKSDGATFQKPKIHSINLFNEIRLDTLGKKITINLDFFSFNNNDQKTYDGFSVINTSFSNQFFKGVNNNNQKVENFSGKFDFDIPTKWVNLSLGSKITTSNSINDIEAFNSGLVNNPINSFQLTNNKFKYKEDIQAIYISGNKKIGDKWEMQTGLRMEATQTKTFSANLNQTNKNNYAKLFQTVYVSYTANENSTFAVNYSRRIDRPSFNDLNPNVYFVNPFQTIEGNPFLQPAFVDNFEFTQTYKKLESKLYYSYEENLFSQIPIADPNTSFIRFTNENYINTNKFGISENYVFDKYKFWTSNNALDLNYGISKSTLAFAQPQKGFNSRISTNNDFILNKDKSLLMNLNYWYSFQGIDGIYKNGAMSSTSISIQYLLLDKNLKISLKGDDLFRTEKVTGNSVVNGIYQNFIYYYDTQSFQLSLNYKFGNNKIKVENRETGNEDERTRTGN
jgi:hypothetical protein